MSPQKICPPPSQISKGIWPGGTNYRGTNYRGTNYRGTNYRGTNLPWLREKLDGEVWSSVRSNSVNTLPYRSWIFCWFQIIVVTITSHQTKQLIEGTINKIFELHYCWSVSNQQCVNTFQGIVDIVNMNCWWLRYHLSKRWFNLRSECISFLRFTKV